SNLSTWPEQLHRLQAMLYQKSDIWYMSMSEDGRLIATSSKDTTAQVWDLATGKPVGPMLRHPQGRISQVVLSPNGELLASVVDAGIDKMVAVWKVGSGDVLWQYDCGKDLARIHINDAGDRMVVSRFGSGADILLCGSGKRIVGGFAANDDSVQI